jgi:hypothetical protein
MVGQRLKQMKRYVRNACILVVVFLGLGVLLINILPDIWFQRHLNKNWNAPEAAPSRDPSANRANRLCLIFALDGVSYDVMEELHKEGYFQGFYEPGRLVSTFPSVTRPAFSRMLIGGKPFGYERLYFDFEENRLKGYTIVKKLFSTDKEHRDYHPKLHFLGFPGYIAYVFPDKFTRTVMDTFKQRLMAFKGDEFIAYMGISDAIAHVEGRPAQKEFLKKISFLLDDTRNELGMMLDVVVFSDHGNNYIKNQWVDLSTPLVKGGFEDVTALNSTKDFVLPRNGFVSVAALYTHPDNTNAMAGLLAQVEGVDFSVYLSGQSIRVNGAAGLARISRRGERYRYTTIEGDPLNLAELNHRMAKLGQSDTQGFILADDWWEATKHHTYPNPLYRIWEGLHDLVQYPATILVSFKDGYAFGPAIFNQAIIGRRQGTHGSLLDTHSNGFLMCDFMTVDPCNPPETVARLLAGAAEAKQKGQKRYPPN